MVLDTVFLDCFMEPWQVSSQVAFEDGDKHREAVHCQKRVVLKQPNQRVDNQREVLHC